MLGPIEIVLLSSLSSPSAAQTQPASANIAATTSTPDPGAQACTNLDFLHQACESLTPGFSDLVFPRQASCLCYGWVNTNAYEPSVHDAFFTSCATYLQASSPSAYGTLSSFYSGHLPSAPCGSAGNVASATTTDSSSATDLLSVASSARVSLMTATQTSAANSQAMYATPSFFSTPTPGEPFVPTPGTATTTPGELTGAEASAGAGPTTATAQQLTRSKGVGARSPDVEAQGSIFAGLLALLAML